MHDPARNKGQDDSMTVQDYRVKPGTQVDLSQWNPDETGDIPDKVTGGALLKIERDRIAQAQERLFAEGKQSLLIIFQAMDTGGKDGAIKGVFKGVNQQGVRPWAFDVPTRLELAHDFLWRVHDRTPEHGMITIFNRSHYEDVLVVRVKNLVPKERWEPRYEIINSFEHGLANHGTRVIKFYLNISKDEQKRRLQSRLDHPEKHWKFRKGDLADRELWDDYRAAYEDALSKCSTDHAPWYVIPANKKWYRDLAIARIIAGTLEDMNPQFPPPEEGLDKVVIPD
jgi:PPK2 family polyphosphate:nucleotide phosphotransferase